MVDRARDVRVPDRHRRRRGGLDPALAQAGDRAAGGAVDLQLEQLVAVDAHAPRRVHLHDRPVLDLERGVGRVLGGDRVRVALLVGPLRDVDRPERRHGAHRPEQVVEHVAPVAEHVDDDPAAVLLAVVPARALRPGDRAGEDPVAELAADGEDAAEEPGVDQLAQLDQPGQEELVLDDAVAHARVAREPGQLQPVGERLGDGLLAVDVLARRDRPADRVRPLPRDLRVEVDAEAGVGERGVEVGGEALEPVLGGEPGELALVAADQHRLGPDHLATVRDAALRADREDRADEVLVVAHAPGHAVHGDPDAPHAAALRRAGRLHCLLDAHPGPRLGKRLPRGSVGRARANVKPVRRSPCEHTRRAAGIDRGGHQSPTRWQRLATEADRGEPCSDARPWPPARSPPAASSPRRAPRPHRPATSPRSSAAARSPCAAATPPTSSASAPAGSRSRSATTRPRSGSRSGRCGGSASRPARATTA